MHLTTSRLTVAYIPRAAALVALCITHIAGAQTTPRKNSHATTHPVPVSAAACLDTVTAHEHDAVASRAQTQVTYGQIAAAKRMEARDCVAALGKKTRPVRDVPALARLQLLAGDTSAAIATVLHYLTLPAANDSVRAEHYVVAIPLLISSHAESSFVRANQLTTELDSMPGASTATKVIGHGGMLSYYRAVDNDDQIEVHASRIIALAPSLDSASRQRAAHVIILAYTAMAEVYGDRAEEKNALAILTSGLTALTDIPDAASRLNEFRDRYALVGMRGAPLVARYWLNADSMPHDSVRHDSVGHDTTARDTSAHDTSAHIVAIHDSGSANAGSASGRSVDSITSYTPVGHVTLVQFTAHWCGPCRKSYPAITRLYNKYSARGVRTVFVTNLYGFMGDHEGLTPQEELDADREYFVNTHDLPFPIGIAVSADSQPGNLDANALHYKVGGIPHIVLLDQHGTIRMIVIGWDPASEARLDAMIASLLDEKIVSR